MRLDDTPESDNIEDRRDDGPASPGGFGGGGFGGGGGGFGLPIGGGGMSGIGVIVVIGAALFLGIDPLALLSGVQSPPPREYQQPRQAQPSQTARPIGRDDEMRRFVGRVLGSTEEVWREQLPAQLNQPYREPTLVLFTGRVNSACGSATAASGPFYCPGDMKVYIDLSFYDLLRTRFRAPGDFAQAYVIGHEVGHHIQRLLGILAKVQERKRVVGQTEANALQVRVELQADCFAGAWAFHANRKRAILEPGDVDEALRAAAAIGDDTLQGQGGRGTIRPETFTHGSAAQRQRWFKRGLQSGSLRDCDTFTAREL
ncbi:MAG: neutral zinc metallopeptidase [Alphaproteobacteria bacterium]|nr:neutral zinc metallopeptidase [Alphaproteobacteria bacterium]MCW5741269.1 neutral zinc metallopeptidase [Alphaproteobacteria bacterium]